MHKYCIKKMLLMYSLKSEEVQKIYIKNNNNKRRIKHKKRKKVNKSRALPINFNKKSILMKSCILLLFYTFLEIMCMFDNIALLVLS